MDHHTSIPNVEKYISIFICILIFMIVLINIDKRVKTVMPIFMEKSEKAVSFEDIIMPKGTVTLEVVGGQSYDDLNILINGEPYYNFKEGKKITIVVFDRDLIQIDGTMYDEEITVKLTSTTKNITTSLLKEEITLGGNIDTLGIIQL